MPYLSLSTDDASILRELLKAALVDLNREIAHTDSREFRKALQERQQALERVLHGIGEAEPHLAGLP